MIDELTPNPVECRSDLNYADTPLAFQWEGRRLLVEEVLQRWRTPRSRLFRVKACEPAGVGRMFELTYDEFEDQWQVQVL